MGSVRGFLGLCVFLIFALLLWISAAEEEPQLTGEQWKQKGDEAFKHRMYEVATDHYSKAIEAEPENYLYYYQRALVLTFRGRSHLAIEDFNSVLALNPTHSSSLLKRAQLHLDNANFDAAEEDFQTALTLKANTKAEEGLNQVRAVKVAIRKAEQLTSESQWDTAAAAWAEVISYSSTTERFLLSRVECLMHIQSYGEALSEAVRALRLNPRSMDCHLSIGEIYYQQGDYENAFTYYKKALKFDPENPRVVKSVKKNQKDQQCYCCPGISSQ